MDGYMGTLDREFEPWRIIQNNCHSLYKEAVMLLVYLQAISSITPEQIFSTIETDPGWMHDIVKYLKAGELPEDEKHAHKICIQSARFTLINECLYRRSFGGPYLRCLSDPKAKYVLVELHEGVWGKDEP